MIRAILTMLRGFRQATTSTSSDAQVIGKRPAPATATAVKPDAVQTRRQHGCDLTAASQRDRLLTQWSLEAGMTPADYAYNCHLLASDLPMLVGPRNVENVP
jgi:hypothetical protein